MADGMRWEIWNGYREFPTPELEVQVAEVIVAHGGRLVGKYPFLFPLLASALYPTMGFKALFVCNIISFAGV